MELSPRLYRWLVRPRWFSDLYIHHLIINELCASDKVILDFGCGTGANCLLTTPEHYMGVDSDATRIQYAKQLYPGYQFKTINGCTIPVADRSIDKILVISVIHHIPHHELEAYLAEFSRILKPKGEILVHEPCHFNHCPVSNVIMNWMDRGKYIQGEDEYLSIFKQCGYRVEILGRYKQLLCYNKLFFKAALKENTFD